MVTSGGSFEIQHINEAQLKWSAKEKKKHWIELNNGITFDVEKCMILKFFFFFSNRNCEQYYSTVAPETQSNSAIGLSIIKQSFLIEKINFTFHSNGFSVSSAMRTKAIINWICLKTIHRCWHSDEAHKRHMSKCIWFKQSFKWITLKLTAQSAQSAPQRYESFIDFAYFLNWCIEALIRKCSRKSHIETLMIHTTFLCNIVFQMHVAFGDLLTWTLNI